MAKTSKFNAGMFDKIKGALAKKESNGSFDNFMKFPAGKTYVIKLLPTLDEDKEPLFHHFVNSWTSKSTGTFTSALSLKTFGENDPITNLRWKLWKKWKEENPNADNKEYTNEIKEQEQWLINALWVDNPDNPELNGKVQILKMGPQIKKLIDAATEGDRADELGWDIFDPTSGYDLKIVAEKKGVFTTYESSFFTTKTKKPLTEEEVEAIYEAGLHDLTQIYPVKTVEELNELLEEHFFCEEQAEQEGKEEKKQLTKKTEKVEKKQKEVKKDKEPEPKVDEDDVNDDIPFTHDTDSDDDEVNALLEGLEDDN